MIHLYHSYNGKLFLQNVSEKTRAHLRPLLFLVNGLPFPVRFYKSRRLLARKLQNPRLLRITFHTFRHWKATTLYHQTKDPLYVKEFMGHKKLDTTLLYIQIERVLYKEQSDEFNVKVARTSEEIKSLLEVGFEYVCKKDGLAFFRKRK